MHVEAYTFFLTSLLKVPPRQTVVEIGARNVNGSLRQIFVRKPPEVYIGVDIMPGQLVDVVADGATYVPDVVPDTVLCAEVLEHTASAEAICKNAWTMLAPGGLFLVSAAGPPRAPHSAIDGCVLRGGEFYKNVDPSELAQWLAPFTTSEVQHDAIHGDVYGVGWK